MGILFQFANYLVKNHEDYYLNCFFCQFCSSIATESPPDTTLRPQCEGFTCPNTQEDGGLYPYDENECSRLYCDCSYGIPFLMSCSETEDWIVFFNPEIEACDWCFNMCDNELCASKY